MDKAARKALCLAVVLLAALPLANASTDSPAASWLKRLKSLEGEWKGTTPGGKPVRLSYKNIAGGTAVMEVFSYGEAQNPQSMYTVYHLDGDNLMLTHFCIVNNQPRMRADLSSKEADVLRFSFVDATNLKKPEDGHMYKAMLRIIDENHIANEWTFRKDNKDAFSEGAQYERIK